VRAWDAIWWWEFVYATCIINKLMHNNSPHWRWPISSHQVPPSYPPH
jgi:hypothetical protein